MALEKGSNFPKHSVIEHILLAEFDIDKVDTTIVYSGYSMCIFRVHH
jgi:hypothetical protein